MKSRASVDDEEKEIEGLILGGLLHTLGDPNRAGGNAAVQPRGP